MTKNLLQKIYTIGFNISVITFITLCVTNGMTYNYVVKPHGEGVMGRNLASGAMYGLTIGLIKAPFYTPFWFLIIPNAIYEHKASSNQKLKIEGFANRYIIVRQNHWMKYFMFSGDKEDFGKIDNDRANYYRFMGMVEYEL
jgi:hypothetical protein